MEYWSTGVVDRKSRHAVKFCAKNYSFYSSKSITPSLHYSNCEKRYQFDLELN